MPRRLLDNGCAADSPRQPYPLSGPVTAPDSITIHNGRTHSFITRTAAPPAAHDSRTPYPVRQLHPTVYNTNRRTAGRPRQPRPLSGSAATAPTVQRYRIRCKFQPISSIHPINALLPSPALPESAAALPQVSVRSGPRPHAGIYFIPKKGLRFPVSNNFHYLYRNLYAILCSG